MMQLHRLAALLGSSTLLLLGAYACSSSDDSTTPEADAGTDTGTIETPDTGTIETPDTGTGKTPDAGSDAGDGGVPSACIGNPLSPDGGTTATAADGGPNQPGALFTVLSGQGGYLYGPQYVDELGGRIVFSEGDNHTLNAAEPDGGTVNPNPLLDFQAQPTINTNGSDYYAGNIYTVTAVQDTGGGSIYRVPLDGGAGVVAATFAPSAFVSPNNIAVTSNGIAFITDPAYQATPTGNATTGVHRVQIDGGALTTVAPDGLPVGVALNKAQTKLYVSYHDSSSVKVWTLDPATSAVTADPVATINTLATYSPAGIAVDQGGNVWVVEQGASSGVIQVFNADGSKEWARVYVTQAVPNGIAFGGPTRTKVFITTETNNSPLYSLESRCPGNL